MRWEIEGADRITGKDVNIFVEAPTEEIAERIAQKRNVIVSSVKWTAEDAGEKDEAPTPHKRAKYDYKMIQIPRTITVKAKNARGQEAAHYLQSLADEQARDGWEFYRVDTVGVVTPAGCLGGLLLQPDQLRSYYVVTFRRELSA
jgi:hypothetical protein